VVPEKQGLKHPGGGAGDGGNAESKQWFQKNKD